METINFNKPATELTVKEYVWLLAWQASLSRGTTPVYAHRDADNALFTLERNRSDET